MNTTTLVESILVSGTATTLAVQMLKSKLIPVPAEHSPRLTAFVVSLIASGIAGWQADIDPTKLTSWTDWLTVACGTLIVSAATYHAVFKETQPAVNITQNIQPSGTGTQHIESLTSTDTPIAHGSGPL
jgi:hypothetical protein